MSFTNEFPNTSYYGSDLRELLEMYKKLISDYNSILANIESANHDYESLLRDNEVIHQRLDKMISDVEAKQNEYNAEFNIKTAEALEQIRNEVLTTLPNFDDVLHEVDTKTNYMLNTLYEFEKDFTNTLDTKVGLVESKLTNVDNKISGVEISVDGKLLQFNSDITTRLQNTNTYITTKIKELYNKLQTIKIDQGEVINPVDGKQDTIQKVFNDLYNRIDGWKLTVDECDALEFNVDEYDNMNLSVENIEELSRWYCDERPKLIKHIFTNLENFKNKLGTYVTNEINKLRAEIDVDGLMRLFNQRTTAYSPISGRLIPLQELFYESIDLFKHDSLTVDELDTLDLSADEYDNKQLTATDYDWKSAIVM